MEAQQQENTFVFLVNDFGIKYIQKDKLDYLIKTNKNIMISPATWQAKNTLK